MAKYDGPEKRYIHRHRTTCISVRYRCKGLRSLVRSRLSDPCEVSDINWRGVRFYAHDKIRKGCKLEVVFDCPVDFSLEGHDGPIMGKVAWREWSKRRSKWRTGIDFLERRDSFRDAMLSMIHNATKHEQQYRNVDMDRI